ncbi:MAG: metallophosphoesterase family protein [Candidatus Geothermincolia bacterium]
MLVGAISDTHLLGRPLPAAVVDAFRGVELILHAGDIVEMAVLSALERMAPVYAVAGNMDMAAVKEALPEQRVVEAGGKRIGLTHGYGSPVDIVERVLREFEDVDAIVFGHTHQPYNRRVNGVYLLNPGSPTDKVFATVNSVGILELGERVTGRIVLL